MDTKRTIFTLCIAFAFFLGFAAVTVAAESYTFNPMEEKSTIFPHGITIGINEIIYVTNEEANTVQMFSPNLDLIKTVQFYGANNSIPFNHPKGIVSIVSNTDGKVFVVDSWNNCTVEFTPDLTYVRHWGKTGTGKVEFILPDGIAAAGNGNLYITDTGNDRVQEVTAEGKWVNWWGRSGHNDREFSHPTGIGVGKDGNIYVADTGNNRIQEFTPGPAYSLKGQWDGISSGTRFNGPHGVGIDSKGNVFVSDTGNNRFVMFKPDGTYLGEYTIGFNNPLGICVNTRTAHIYVADHNNNRFVVFEAVKVPEVGVILNYDYVNQWGTQGTGNFQFNQPGWATTGKNGVLYVVDSGNNRIEMFSSLGVYIGKWGSTGSGIGQFSSPKGITADIDGNIYVVDNGNSRIQKFNRNGTFIRQWGSYGYGNGQFYHPEGITAVWEGNIFVVDSGNNRVQEFTTDGSYVGQWGSLGSAEGQFSSPEGITSDSTGNFYVVDSGNNRVEKFTKFKTFVPDWGTSLSFNHPRGITKGTNGNIYIADSGNNRIQEVTVDGEYVGEWGSYGYGNILSAKNKFNRPGDVAIGSNGNIYVVDTGNNRIEQFYSTWPFKGKWGSYGIGKGQFNQPAGIAIDKNGYIYVVDAVNNRVEKFTSSGSYLTQFGSYGIGNGQNVKGKLFKPDGIAIGSGNVYVVDSGNDRVEIFTQNGKYVGEWESFGKGDNMFIHATGIATDTIGNVYVVDSANYRIIEFTYTGGYIRNISGIRGNGDGEFEYPGPSGIAVNATGYIYVADYGNNRIQVFDNNGKYLSQWGTSGSDNGQFYYPMGIAIITAQGDRYQDVLVVDRGNNRVQEFTSTGEYVTQWGSLGKGDGQFSKPDGIAIVTASGDAFGEIYVTDTSNNRVQRFSLSTPPPIPAQPTPTPTPALLKADFTANRTTGAHPLPVSFKDLSSGSPTAWLWSFGDGNTSKEQNPVNTYPKKGAYSVKLKVSSSSGTDTLPAPLT